MSQRLPIAFFERQPEQVARDLLGKVLVRRLGEEVIAGIVTETEAYGGADDPASHAFNKKTARNWPMFEDAGLTYVYFIYGMHYCFNVSIGKPGQVGAVLIRSVEKLTGEKVPGPGRVGKLFRFSTTDSGVQTTDPAALIFFEDQGYQVKKVVSSPRVGIRKGLEKPWRFVATTLEAPLQ